MSFLINPHGFGVPPGPSPGHGSFLFDGTNDYAELASAPVTTTPCTIVAWWRDIGSPSTCGLVSVGNSAATSRMQLDTRATGDDFGAAAVNSGGTSGVANGGTVVDSVWTHGAAVFTSATSRSIYQDGTFIQTDTANIVVSGLNNIILGARYSGGSRGGFAGGRLAHVAVWNIALSGGDITSLAGGALPSAVQSGNLVFYAPLTHGNAKDVISNTNLTVSGAISDSIVSPAGT